MAMSSSLVSEIWGRLTYKMPNSTGVLESADVKGGRYVIGRAKGCDLRIGLKMISGHHCYLGKEENGTMYLYDTSTNGTIVNDNRVVNGQRREIFDGDIFYLVRKKSSPDQDFHLVFKTIPRRLEDDESGTSSAEPKAKRIKVETVTSSNDVAIKIENNPEFELPNTSTGTVTESDKKENEVPALIDFSECKLKAEEPILDEDADLVKDDEAKKDEVDKIVSSTSSDDSIEDILKCSLCLEIFHDPVCLQPCMHCYCSGCYSEWMTCANECPQCRASVKLVARNHMISSLTDTFLKANPHKRRSLSEIVWLDSKNTIDKNSLYPQNNQHPVNCQCETCADGSNSSNNSGSSSPIVYQNLPQKICQQCPGNAKTLAASQPGSSTSTQIPDFVCGPNQSHISCACCFKLMPDRRNEDGAKPQTCELCLGIFCHMYWGCIKHGCSGCLNKFSALKYSNNNLSKLINDNTVETRILSDYARTKDQNMQNIIEECFRSLDSGTYKLAVILNSNSVLCYKCGLSNLQTLAYKYRTDIPNADLPDSVTSRPNCYWGLNCRTQKHNINHAQKYNHICNQTRF